MSISKNTWTSLASAAALAVLLGCGGGGGGGDVDDGTGDDPAPPLPMGLAFSGGAVSGVPMTVSADGLSLPISGFGFRGNWDRAANRYTLPPNESFLNIDFGLLGELATRVSATTSWVGFMPPADSGTISAQSLVDASETPLFTGIASVTALSNAAVQLSWNGTTPATTVNYSWDAFLNDDLPTDWETGIQIGSSALALGIGHVQLALDQFVFINANDAQLVSAGTAGTTQACAGGAGTRKVVWNDANGDSALGPGDGFTVTYTSCRIDLPGDIDQILNGQIVISGYIENSSPFSVGGRVDFVGLQQTEAEPNGVSVSTTGSVQLFISAN